MIPIPPSQCVSWRQNSIARPSASHVRQHRRAGGGEARHRLEVRIDRVLQLLDPAEQERQRAERGHQHPHQRHDQEHLARPERPPSAVGRQSVQGQADHRRWPARRSGTAAPTRRLRARRRPAPRTPSASHFSSAPTMSSASTQVDRRVRQRQPCAQVTDAARSRSVRAPAPPRRRAGARRARSRDRRPAVAARRAGTPTVPSRTITPTTLVVGGSSANGRPASRLSGRTAMSRTSKRSSSSIAT